MEDRLLKITVALDAGNKEIDVDVNEANVNVNNLLNAGALAAKNTVATADIDNDAVTLANMADLSTTSRIVGSSDAQLAAWTILASTLLNLDEVVSK